MKLKLVFILLFITSFCLSQQAEYVDFKSALSKINLDPKTKSISGMISYKFDIVQQTDSIFVDAQNMTFDFVFLNNDTVQFFNDNKKLWIISEFKPSKNNEVLIGFKANPIKAMYFIDWDYDGHFENLSNQKSQVWTQGQGKYTSNWLPSIDDMNDKIEFDLSITFDKDYEVIANGDLTSKQINDSTATWHYDMQNPMSSYLVALAIGKYDKKVAYAKSGIPIEMYYYPVDSLKFEPTYRYTKRMFDFLEEEIGVPYPWQNYKQVPVKDFLYAGMENTSLTIFSDSFVIDSIGFVDKNYVNVNAHELAHQWFGNLVTETSSTHHWLQEGFATYYALLAEKDIFGEDYYYWRLYEYAQELKAQDEAGKSTSLLDPKSSSTTFYKKGAWVLHLLREKVGDKAFKEAVKNYLMKHRFKNVETNDFIGEVQIASGEGLSGFVQNYFIDTKFFINKLNECRQVFLAQQGLNFEIMDPICLSSSKRSKWASCLLKDWDICLKEKPEAWRAYLTNRILKDTTSTKNQVIKNILTSSDIKARQQIAHFLNVIPAELKSEYESLLDDNSYLTIEMALLHLWKNFPKSRNTYLEQTENIQGFNDKNFRILWLTLALLTDDFENENKSDYYQQLIDYTNPNYHFEIRQNAFQYLSSINACNDECQNNLKDASVHHVWQFKKFAKQLLNNFS